MKTTLDLPDALVKQVKLRALHEGRKLKDAVADLLRKGLAAGVAEPELPAPVITRDKKTGLPLIKGGHAASPQEEITPERGRNPPESGDRVVSCFWQAKSSRPVERLKPLRTADAGEGVGLLHPHRANSLLRQQLAQHILQDAAVLVIAHLLRRIDAHQRLELLVAGRLHRDFASVGESGSSRAGRPSRS